MLSPQLYTQTPSDQHPCLHPLSNQTPRHTPSSCPQVAAPSLPAWRLTGREAADALWALANARHWTPLLPRLEAAVVRLDRGHLSKAASELKPGKP
jgi:hypothetical protein